MFEWALRFLVVMCQPDLNCVHTSSSPSSLCTVKEGGRWILGRETGCKGEVPHMLPILYPAKVCHACQPLAAVGLLLIKREAGWGGEGEVVTVVTKKCRARREGGGARRLGIGGWCGERREVKSLVCHFFYFLYIIVLNYVLRVYAT